MNKFRGKEAGILSPEEIKKIDENDNLIETIALLEWFGVYFGKTDLTEADFKNLLKQEYDKHSKGKNNPVKIEDFAQNKAASVNSKLNKIRALNKPEMWEGDERFEDAQNYVGFLSRYKQIDNSQDTINGTPDCLLSLFQDVSKYKKIMNILADKSLIEHNTELWKDEGKGSKGYLVSLIKNLHLKQYFKEDKKPSNEQIKVICKNTFGIEISIETIKRIRENSFDFQFIPYSSTIE